MYAKKAAINARDIIKEYAPCCDGMYIAPDKEAIAIQIKPTRAEIDQGLSFKITARTNKTNEPNTNKIPRIMCDAIGICPQANRHNFASLLVFGKIMKMFDAIPRTYCTIKPTANPIPCLLSDLFMRIYFKNSSLKILCLHNIHQYPQTVKHNRYT